MSSVCTSLMFVRDTTGERGVFGKLPTPSPLSNVRKSKQLVFVNSAAEPDKCLTFSITGRANSHKLQMDYEIQLPRSRSESAATCISTFHQTHLKVFIVTVTRHVWSRVGVLCVCVCVCIVQVQIVLTGPSRARILILLSDK